MTSEHSHIPDAETLLTILAEKLSPLLQKNTALVGIQSGGVWVMQNLMAKLEKTMTVHAIEYGTLDVSFYRDDYAKRGLKPENQPSQIPFDVENKHIILIDDVFYTGRTTRAAMNELFDYGRPASITLIALVNRGGRELPISPQITALELSLAATQNLQLVQHADGRLGFTLKSLTPSNQQAVSKHE
ncbi:MAG: bifunctional pyr operon transcriptional regulator/uracil phosphoribosyltransferase PyrR [Methylotenera sp.]|nr:bifunctional pyr operon transcriptional regulator/uracil phosphoribosyltransferase PyrR [Methylotenera sp.]